MRCRGRFVPIECFEIFANELFVERGLGLSGRVFVGFPKSRRIGRQYLVNKQNVAVGIGDVDAFCVRDNNALGQRILALPYQDGLTFSTAAWPAGAYVVRCGVAHRMLVVRH